ncbi:hypothetical protein N9045_01075 [bacterium]|nr:hypothetical protein [bacterium]
MSVEGASAKYLTIDLKKVCDLLEKKVENQKPVKHVRKMMDKKRNKNWSYHTVNPWSNGYGVVGVGEKLRPDSPANKLTKEFVEQVAEMLNSFVKEASPRSKVAFDAEDEGFGLVNPSTFVGNDYYRNHWYFAVLDFENCFNPKPYEKMFEKIKPNQIKKPKLPVSVLEFNYISC